MNSDNKRSVASKAPGFYLDLAGNTGDVKGSGDGRNSAKVGVSGGYQCGRSPASFIDNAKQQ